MLCAMKEINQLLCKEMRGRDDQFKLEGVPIYEGWHRTVLAEGIVCSEADWTVA